MTNRKDTKQANTSTSGKRVGSLSNFVKSKIEYGKQEKALQWWKLKFGPRSGPRTGNEVLNWRTKVSYDVHIKFVVTFCFLIGDFDPFCPKFATSMKVLTFVLYLQYKFQEPHEFLTDTNGLPILNIEGMPLICVSS